MGWPLKPLISSTYSLPSQPLGVSSSIPVETTLVASPMMAPRVSTFCANVMGGDVHRVICQCPHSSPNRALAGAGIGRGSARRPMRASGSWGQVLANMLTKTGSGRGQTLAGKLGGTSIGRGQSAPSPPVRRPEQRGRHADAHTEASLPPPITMHLARQVPPVTYSKAAPRPPWRVTISPNELSMCDVWVKITAHKKEKEAAQATLNWIQKQEQDKQATMKKEKERELRKAQQCDAGCKLAKEGARWQEEYNHEWRASRACPDPITNPLGWCEYSGPRKTSMKVPHGLEIYGVPAPWTTNNWQPEWSAHGALLRPTSGPGRTFTFAHWHPMSWRPLPIRSTMTLIRY